ncbi:MAG TPA: sensor histidine kinase [Verrucomicrobiae bacterium]
MCGVLFLGVHLLRADQGKASGGAGNGLEIDSVMVAGKEMLSLPNREIKVGAFPEQITFHFGPVTSLGRSPARLRYKLEGYENNWHIGEGRMNLTARFYNAAGDQISHETFNVGGDSPGWTGSLKTSSLAHRRETLVAPPFAAKTTVVISSAGPAATEGIYVVANLSVARLSDNSSAPEVLQSPLATQPDEDNDTHPPFGWMRDGLTASMAKIVKIGHDPTITAFAILDNDPLGHAEWRNTLDPAPRVKPGDKLLIEWNEMYSMGVSDIRSGTYASLEPGKYTFRVEELDLYGMPTGVGTSLRLTVSEPFWKTPWFWVLIFIGSIAAILGGGRYIVRKKMKHEMLRLKNEQALERERIRIAHDIHDDLGARVTQISLVSALACDNATFPRQARAEFDQITKMSRELVIALYETVWAVTPENDNLYSLGNYLCQMVNQLCERSQIRCRFHLNDLPRSVQASSQIRHNITMVVKEAVHNVIKHASASEVTIGAVFAEKYLTVTVHDNGHGFQSGSAAAGHGLKNIKQRMEDIGGNFQIESQIGRGTTIQLKLVFK